MFYAHFVLAKKGPLSKIWLAAHWDKKLTKAHVFETNIETSVDGILKPKVKMALRTSGHLLLGVVRIYSRKAKYLLQDCNEAFVKIKMAFRPGMVDLPEEHREAAMNAITLPEVFHDFDTAMPELNEVDIEAQFSLNQSRAEEITMREDYGSLNLVTHDDGFGDMGFDTDNPDIMREAIGGASALEQSNLLFDGSSLDLGGKAGMGSGPSGVPSLSAPSHDRRMEVAPQAQLDDGFGGTIGDVSDFGHAGGLFEGDLFGDVTAGGSGAATQGMPGTSAQPQSLQAEIEAAGAGAADAGEPPDSDDDLPDHYDAGSPGHHSWGDSPMREDPVDLMPPPAAPHPAPPGPPTTETMELPVEAAPEPPTPPGAGDNTTLLNNDEESFALAPVDATVLKGITKTKRKRKLIVDEVKNISGEEMKNQLSNTSDIVTSLDLAPPTRRLMHWKETGGVEKLFALPARPIPSSVLFKKFQRNMTVRSEGDEGEGVSPDPARDPEGAPRRSHRKRRQDEMVEPIPTPAPPVADLEPPTPIPHEYEPSVEHTDGRGGYLMTPRHDELEPPNTPGMGLLHDGELSLPPTPAMHQAGLHPGSLTPSLGLDAALAHGGLTPAGLAHGGLTPAGLAHGGLTPTGLVHGGLTPAGLVHGGLTPAGLVHGGLTPGGLGHGGLTPGGLGHGGLTPGGLDHGGMTPAGLHHGGMTPSGLQHGMLLHGAEQSPMLRPHMGPPHDLDQAMDNLEQHSHYQSMQMTNLGYDEHQGGNSPQHDYDLPPSVDNGMDEEREQGETDEQFEERVLNRRAAQLFAVMRPKLAQGETLTFSELAPAHNNRKQVAQKFYSLLVLKKHQVLKLKQEETYGPLIIARGVQFETEAI